MLKKSIDLIDMEKDKDDFEKLGDQLQQVVWDNEKIMEDRVFALATGSLAVSLTIFQLQDDWTVFARVLMASSWVVLLVDIFVIMYSLYIARGSAERAAIMTYSVNKENSNLLFDEMSRGNKRTKRQNRCSYILTGLGMLLTAAAAFITLIIN
jgi:hypothetical protein